MDLQNLFRTYCFEFFLSLYLGTSVDMCIFKECLFGKWVMDAPEWKQVSTTHDPLAPAHRVPK